MEWLLVLLAFEKIVQHAAVTWAFVADVGALRSEVSADWRWFAAVGAVVGLLFVAAGGGFLARRGWSLTLLSVLAAADIVGEFVAQATGAITITASLVVAVLIIVVSHHLAKQATAAGAARGADGRVKGLHGQGCGDIID